VTRALAPPDAATWRERAEWFWRAHDFNAGPHAPEPDASVDALFAELEAVFCTGAWGSCVILAWAICESITRRAAAGRDLPADLDLLRERRNRLVHGEAAAHDERELRGWAEGAVRIAFRAWFEASHR
jgi:hypothetical protein